MVDFAPFRLNHAVTEDFLEFREERTNVTLRYFLIASMCQSMSDLAERFDRLCDLGCNKSERLGERQSRLEAESTEFIRRTSDESSVENILEPVINQRVASDYDAERILFVKKRFCFGIL